MTDLTSFERFWKLPSGFISAKPLPDNSKICEILEDPGSKSNLIRLEVYEASIFCPTGWLSNPQGLDPYLIIYDPLTKEAVASIGKTSSGELYVPFCVKSVIEAFQSEHYTKSASFAGLLGMGRQFYYLLRPIIPRSVQIKFRQSITPLQSRQDFPQWPLDVSLDYLLKLVLRMIMQASGISEIPFIWFWPNSFSFAVTLTHDVETLVGFENVWRIASLERKYGFRSLWNFVPERYPIDDQLLMDLVADGFEVGVHGLNHDGHLFDSYELFKSRARKINGYLNSWKSQGFRSPSAIRNLTWISTHIQALYDSSCPTTEKFAPQPGGCCSVFPFMVNEMVEIPFTMPQDHTLFRILNYENNKVWIDIASHIKSLNGLVSVIVHPDYMLSSEDLANYEALLAFLASQDDAWFALPQEVAGWWKSRDSQSLIHDAANWEINGLEAQKARVAFATLEDQELIFEF
jgi:peptidoglycan/xylan/chitin deacetylase (PgdA/CDA1 family)